MIAIISRSSYLASSLSCMLGTDAAVCPASSDNSRHHQWLSSVLVEKRVSVVFYEPGFFIDPAPFRKLSPATRFVVMASPGEEEAGINALSHGAAAMLGKPIDNNAVNGVFQLVSS